MPLYNEEQKQYIVKEMGYDPSEFDYDESLNSIVKRNVQPVSQVKASPSTSEHIDSGKIELPKSTETITPLVTGAGSFVENVPAGLTGMYVSSQVAKTLAPMMKSLPTAIAGTAAIIGSGLLTSKLTKTAQDSVTEKVMPETMGALREGQIANPNAAKVGGIASIIASGMNPSPSNVIKAVGTGAKLVTGMSPKVEEIANLANVAGGTGVGTGIDWLNQNILPGGDNKFNLLESLAINSVFNKPNKIGKKLGLVDPSEDIPSSEATSKLLATAKQLEALKADKEAANKIQGLEIFTPEKRPYATAEEFWNDLAKIRELSEDKPLDYSLKLPKESKKTEKTKKTKNQEVNGPLTGQQKELLNKTDLNEDPIYTTEYWDKFWDELGQRRNVKVTEDGTLVNSETGNPVAGAVPERVGNETVEAKINPNKAGADTRPHEIGGHPFYNDLKKSPRYKDQVVASKIETLASNDPDYKTWKSERDAAKLDSSVEEYLATNTGTEAVRRAIEFAPDKSTKQKFESWWKDISSYYKTRFTKHATLDEMQRVLNYKLLHDPSYKEVFKNHSTKILKNIAAESATPKDTSINTSIDETPVNSTIEEIPQNIVPKTPVAKRDKNRPVIPETGVDEPVPEITNEEFGPTKPEIRTFDEAVQHLKNKGTSDLNKNDIQKLFKDADVIIGREAAGDIAKEAFGNEWKPKATKNSEESILRNMSDEDPISSDTELYNNLVESFKNETDLNKKMEYWKNIEAIKNKYGGKTILPRTKNQEQSTLAGLDDKKIRAASAFAKMREATDNPEIVKQAEKEDIANTIAENNTKIDKKAGIDRSSEMYSSDSILKQTETPEFKKWFGDSKVKDEETGKPLIVYHGTSVYKDFNAFNAGKSNIHPSAGYVGNLGSFFGSSTVANEFVTPGGRGYKPIPNYKDKPRIYPVFLSLKNPLKFDSIKDLYSFVEKKLEEAGDRGENGEYLTRASQVAKLKDSLIKQGYDGISFKEAIPFKSDVDAGNAYIAFHPEQVKSAIGNTGAFDPTNKDIRYSTSSALIESRKPEFKKWFGDSKVVDPETGKPLVVYHGSSENDGFSVFDKSKVTDREEGRKRGYVDWLGHVNYFTPSKREASAFALNEKSGDSAAVYPVYLNIKNPFDTRQEWKSKETKNFLKEAINFFNKNSDEYLNQRIDFIYGNQSLKEIYRFLADKFGGADKANEFLIKKGYDGIIDKSHDIGLQYATFYPEQIKSATGNTGEFDPKNPDIRYSTSSALFEFRKPEIDKIRELDHKDAGKVADAFTDFYRSYNKYRGMFSTIGTKKLIDNLSYTDPKERFLQDNEAYQRTVQYLDDMMDIGTSKLTPDPEALKIIKEVNELTLKHKAKSLDLKGLKGHEYYLAQIPARNVLDTIINKPESAKAKQLMKDWFDYYENILSKDRKEALKELKVFKAGYRKQNSDLASQYGPIDKSAGVGIPSSWREKNLIDRLGRFIDRYSRRLAFIDNIENNKVVNQALNDPIKGIGGSDVVRNVMFDIEGQRDIAESNLEAIGGLIKSAWMGTLTGAKDFTSNLFLGMQHQTLDQTVESPIRAWANIKKNLKESYEAGVNRQNIGSIEMIGDDSTINNIFQIIRRSRDVINTLSGRNFLEKITRATAFGQGKWMAQDNIWRAHKGNLNSQSEKFLNDFVPDWKSYVKSGILPADVLERAATDYVGSVQGNYDYRGLPLRTQRGSLAPYLSLSRWSIEKLNNFEKYAVKPAMQGNYRPLLNQTIGLIIGGAAVTAITEALTGRKEKAPKLEELKELHESGEDVILPLTYKLAAYASLSGYAGMYGDIAKMMMDRNYKNRTQTINNPLIEGVETLVKNTGDYIQAIKEDGASLDSIVQFIEKNLEDSFQVYRLIAANTSTEKQKEIKESNEFRDLKLYKNTHGDETPESSENRANPFRDKDIKKFRDEEDYKKVATQADALIRKALEEAHGDISKLRKEFRKMKYQKNTAMPSFDEAPDSFKKYLLFLEKTQGREEAVKRARKYFEKKNLNEYKSSLIPEIN